MLVGIAGASGYTGIELLRVLINYEDIEINQITSRQYRGKTLKEVFPFFSKTKYENLKFSEEFDIDSSDFYFLCLPHEPSVELVKLIIEKGKKVIDLSAAYRIKDEKVYEEYYGFKHKYKELLKSAVYGLPEIFREKIKNAKLVANPGCYPTATLLALFPAVKEGVIEESTVIVNALSGISGAGRGLKQQFHYPEAFGNSYPYAVKKHRHTPEMEGVLKEIGDKDIKVRFTPHILPVSRGMISTVNFKTDIDEYELKKIYESEYRNEFFIKIVDSPPHIKDVIGTNFCHIYISVDDRTGFATVISAIDNLGKGASLQAVQNFNIMTGRKEELNLEALPLFP